MESSNYPKVIILLATFNRAHLILQTLESIQNQTYNHFECYITDDNSTDNTEEIVDPFINTDSRFFYFKKPNNYVQGLSATRNFGLDLTKNLRSKYILFVDDDDILHPQNLEICIKVLDNDNLDFIHYKLKPFEDCIPNFIKVQGFKQIDDVTYKRLIDVLDNKIPLASCSVMWKRTALSNERFKEDLYYAEELEFYTRLLIKERIGGRINVVLYFNRKHQRSNTGAFFNGDFRYTRSLIKAYHLCINNLLEAKKMNYGLAKFFVWKAVIKKEESIYREILRKSPLNFIDLLKLWFLYNLSGFVHIYLSLKKRCRIRF